MVVPLHMLSTLLVPMLCLLGLIEDMPSFFCEKNKPAACQNSLVTRDFSYLGIDNGRLAIYLMLTPAKI